MTLHQFRMFAAIAKFGNLTKAALELRTSQPAISHQMKLLQDSYGATLYQRTAFGVALTPAGERLLVAIGPILEMVGKLKSGGTPALTRKPRRDGLCVGGVESASAHLLPAVLAEFRAVHPDVELEFRTRTSDLLERRVLNGSMDLAVTARRPVSLDLHCQPLRREAVALFVPAHHRLGHKKNIQMTDLQGETFILRGGGGVTDRALKQLCDRGLKIRIGMYCDGPTAIKAAVAQGMGIGMIFEEALKADVAAGKYKILKVAGLELEGESYVIYAKRRPLSTWAEDFLELLGPAAKQPQFTADPMRENRLHGLPKHLVSDSLSALPSR